MFNVLFWIVWLLIGLLLAALFSAIVLPRLLLEMKASLHPIADRGIGKFNLKNGISVLYEPSRSERKYLRCYQLFRRGDRSVSFMGCWNRAVFTARYTLLCFNSLGRPIAFYRVCESFIDGRYYTRTVTLPPLTATAAPKRYAAADMSPGTWTSHECSPLRRTVTVLPSVTISAPIARSMSSV